MAQPQPHTVLYTQSACGGPGQLALRVHNPPNTRLCWQACRQGLVRVLGRACTGGPTNIPHAYTHHCAGRQQPTRTVAQLTRENARHYAKGCVAVLLSRAAPTHLHTRTHKAAAPHARTHAHTVSRRATAPSAAALWLTQGWGLAMEGVVPDTRRAHKRTHRQGHARQALGRVRRRWPSATQ
jgi:hypothetical protein